jgi:hypothetical protein
VIKRIAIVDAGTAGLHLGLHLQQKGGQSRIFTDKKIEDYPSVRLLNTVAHHAVTTTSSGCRARRSSSMGIWPGRAVDYRIYLPTLMTDFEERGGRIEYLAISVAGPHRIVRGI